MQQREYGYLHIVGFPPPLTGPDAASERKIAVVVDAAGGYIIQGADDYIGALNAPPNVVKLSGARRLLPVGAPSGL